MVDEARIEAIEKRLWGAADTLRTWLLNETEE